MRRSFAVLSIVGLLGTGFGCNHMAGVCDCAIGPTGHWTPPPHMLAGQPGLVAPPPGQAPEPIKAMPKAADKTDKAENPEKSDKPDKE